MAAAIETMFYTREKPWHGLGTQVQEAPDSRHALELAGLDWQVIQKRIKTVDDVFVPGFRANVRETDGQVLGMSPTVTRWFRMRMPSPLQMICWARALLIRFCMQTAIWRSWVSRLIS